MVDRVFMNYRHWEDWKSGLYATSYADEDIGAALSAILLSDADDCNAAMDAVVKSWPNSAMVQLTHRSQNRRAWLGQAAACFVHSVPAFVTCMGWRMLNECQQEAANMEADAIIARWENGYAQELFDR